MSTELKADGTVELRVEREFAYSPKQVFEAWLRPEQLMQWMGPNDEINVSKATVNAVEGGHYIMEFIYDEGGGSKLTGAYKTIERYTKLAFTWAWDKPEEEGASDETLVTLDFLPTEKGTQLVLVHQKFPNKELRDRHYFGWNGTFDKLERRAVKMFGE